MGHRHALFALMSFILLMQCTALVPIFMQEQSLKHSANESSVSGAELSFPSSWLSGWSFRKAYNITGLEGAGTNYQVKAIVHNGSGDDSGYDIYCDGNCQADFDDIRFTDDDGITLLHYWMQTKVLGSYAAFWVEVTDSLDSSVTIYVYYGNATAESASNGDATFIFFDDFLGDPVKWNITDMTNGSQVHSYDITDSKLHVHAESNAWLETSGYTFQTKNAFSTSGGTGFHLCASGNWANLPDVYRGEGWIQCLALEDGLDTGLNIRLRGDFKITIWEYLDSVTYRQIADPADYANGTAQFDYFVNSSSKFFEMGLVSDRSGYSQNVSATLPDFTFESYRIQLWAIVQYWSLLVKVDIYYDYVFMTKWVSSDLSGIIRGSEELPTNSTTTTTTTTSTAELPTNSTTTTTTGTRGLLTATTIIVAAGALAVIVVFSGLTFRGRGQAGNIASNY